MEPVIVSAFVAGIVSIVVSLIANAVARDRLAAEFKLEFATETAIKALLDAGTHDMRTFEKIKGYLPGFADDNELRRYLIRAGGVSFKRKTDDVELWGLLSKHQGDAFK